MDNTQSVIFNRSGLGTLSDVQSEEYRSTFSFLENEQREFLSKEKLFRSPSFNWPRDPLHTWSRVWEYPYVYHHLKTWRGSMSNDVIPRVVDVGSGVNFFPFSVARLGCQVTCIDNDKICEEDMNKAILHVPCDPGRVEFKLSKGSALPIEDEKADAVYCISVLEHVDDFTDMVREMNRILKPGGLLVLTIDLDLKGDSEIGVDRYKKLKTILEEQLEYKYLETVDHPADILVTNNGPYPLAEYHGGKLMWYLFKQWILYPLLFRKPNPLPPAYNLAVQGFVLSKKSVQ